MAIDVHARPWLPTSACLLGLAFWVCTCQLVAGELYRWQDANGNPAISDRPPPPGTPFVKIDDRRFGMKNQWSQSSTSNSSDNTSTSQAAATVNLNANASQSRIIVNKQRTLCQQAKDNIFKLAVQHFYLGVGEVPPDEVEEKDQHVWHSTKFVLVNPQHQIIGYFDSQSEIEMKSLLGKVSGLSEA